MLTNPKSGFPKKSDGPKLVADLNGILKEINKSLEVNTVRPRPPVR